MRCVLSLFNPPKGSDYVHTKVPLLLKGGGRRISVRSESSRDVGLQLEILILFLYGDLIRVSNNKPHFKPHKVGLS